MGETDGTNEGLAMTDPRTCPHVNTMGHEWESWCLECGERWPNNLHNRSVLVGHDAAPPAQTVATRQRSTGFTVAAIENRVTLIEEHMRKHDGVEVLTEGTRNVIRLCLMGESIVGPEHSHNDVFIKPPGATAEPSPAQPVATGTSDSYERKAFEAWYKAKHGHSFFWEPDWEIWQAACRERTPPAQPRICSFCRLPEDHQVHKADAGCVMIITGKILKNGVQESILAHKFVAPPAQPASLLDNVTGSNNVAIGPACREHTPSDTPSAPPGKRLMRLPKNAAHPNFSEIHEEDDWCAKAGCRPVWRHRKAQLPPVAKHHERLKMQRETREESVERIFNFLGHKTDQAPASIKEALFQAYDAATGVAAEGSPSKTLREKVQKLAFHHECDQGGGKYIVLLDDIDALLAAEGIPEDRLADKIEYLGEGASEGYQLACRDVAKLLRWGWPFLDPVAAEGGQPSGPSEAALHNHDDPGDRINRCSSY